MQLSSFFMGKHEVLIYERKISWMDVKVVFDGWRLVGSDWDQLNETLSGRSGPSEKIKLILRKSKD